MTIRLSSHSLELQLTPDALNRAQPGERTGRCFQAFGRDWALNVFLAGDSAAAAGFLSLYLELLPPTEASALTVGWKADVAALDGPQRMLPVIPLTESVFDAVAQTWGRRKALSHRHLGRFLAAAGDVPIGLRVRIQCHLVPPEAYSPEQPPLAAAAATAAAAGWEMCDANEAGVQPSAGALLQHTWASKFGLAVGERQRQDQQQLLLLQHPHHWPSQLGAAPPPHAAACCGKPLYAVGAPALAPAAAASRFDDSNEIYMMDGTALLPPPPQWPAAVAAQPAVAAVAAPAVFGICSGGLPGRAACWIGEQAGGAAPEREVILLEEADCGDAEMAMASTSQPGEDPAVAASAVVTAAAARAAGQKAARVRLREEDGGEEEEEGGCCPTERLHQQQQQWDGWRQAAGGGGGGGSELPLWSEALAAGHCAKKQRGGGGK